MAAGIFLTYSLPSLIVVISLALLTAGALFCKKRPIALLLCVCLLGALYFTCRDSGETVLEGYDGGLVSVSGRVESVQQKDGWLSLEVSARACEYKGKTKKTKEKILVTLNGDPSSIAGGADLDSQNIQSLAGKDVCFTGEISLAKAAVNPGLFDYRLYLKTRGINTLGKANVWHFSITGHGNPVTTFLAEIRQRFSLRLDGEMGREEKGLLIGMLFGDKSYLDEETIEAFRKNGTTHVLAVSGIHVTIIYLCMDRLLRRRKTPLSSLLSACLLLIYAALSCFSPSVVRAVVMIVLHLFSRHLYRRYDLTCSAAFSAMLFLLHNPYMLFNTGFQLSYLAVFTMAFLLPFADNTLEKLAEYRRYHKLYLILKIFVPVAVIQAGMIPATAFLFQYISFAAFLVNVPIIALSGIIIPVGMFLFLFTFTGGLLFSFLATGTSLLLKATSLINETTAELTFSSVNVTAPSAAFLVLWYGLVYFAASEVFWEWVRARRPYRIAAVVLLVAAAAFAAPFLTGETERRADIVFVDVGQGDGIHIRTPGGQNILIDGGGSADYDVGKKILLPYFLKNGVAKIDLAIVTHLHLDHFGGVASLTRLMPVEKLAVYEGEMKNESEFLAETALTAEDVLYIKKGTRIRIEEGVWIEILYPPQEENSGGIPPETQQSEEADENSATLVARVVFDDASILLTGDLGFAGEDDLSELYGAGADSPLRSDVLKVGHHGSRYSTGDRFLECVAPSLAVIQVGQNNFGHPHPDVIEKLEKKDIMVCRTDQTGAVLLDIENGKIRIRTML